MKEQKVESVKAHCCADSAMRRLCTQPGAEAAVVSLSVSPLCPALTYILLSQHILTEITVMCCTGFTFTVSSQVAEV